MSAAVTDYDVAVCGGGLVGASLALALAGLPLRIALVEAVPFGSAAQPSFDERSIALSRTSARILASLGLWAGIAGEAAAIREIQVTERGRFGNAVISGVEQGVGDLGYVVASRVLGAELWRRLEAVPNVAIFCPASLANPRAGADGIAADLTASGGTTVLESRLLAVADGARSAMRAGLGVAAAERSYEQVAIVGNVAVAGGSSGQVAYERFTAAGPLALLPFHDGRFVFVMARSKAAAGTALAMDDGSFLELLQDGFGRRLGRFERLGTRSAYPLALVRAGAVTAPRAAIIGNAAHGLHPVAGQGYNLGLRDVATLAEVVADALRAGDDPGGERALARYRRWRARDQRNVVHFTDGLVRLFGVPGRGIGAVRGLGLLLFDVSPGGKRALARHAMGMGGTMTRLARGLPL